MSARVGSADLGRSAKVVRQVVFRVAKNLEGLIDQGSNQFGWALSGRVRSGCHRGKAQERTGDKKEDIHKWLKERSY